MNALTMVGSVLFFTALSSVLVAEEEVSIAKDASLVQQDRAEAFRLKLEKALGPLSDYALIAVEPFSRFPQATALKIDDDSCSITVCDFLRTDDGRVQSRELSREEANQIIEKAEDLFKIAEVGMNSKDIPVEQHQSSRVFVFINKAKKEGDNWRSLKVVLNENASRKVFEFFRALSGRKDFTLKLSSDPWSSE